MRKLNVNLVAQCGIVLCGLLLMGNATRAKAQQLPGPHPNYLHALRNLREARGLLQINFGQAAHVQAAAIALPAINDAIGELKAASKLDDKSLGDVPPPNNSLPPEGRFHKVADLLASAHHDTKGQESDPAAIPYKERALKHIDAASAAVAKVL
jgi:hypothetical protein